MRLVVIAASLLLIEGMILAAGAQTSVAQADAAWTIENDALRVTVDTTAGLVRVLDKRTQYTWRQPSEMAGVGESGTGAVAPKFRAVRRVDQPGPGLAFETDLSPMEGGWIKDRELFVRTCRNVCPLQEAVAETEMLSHEFVTPDHHVQRTRFSDGTEVAVNFGEAPYTASVGGRDHVLPQNGFVAKGPRIEQSLELVDGKPVTTVQGSGAPTTPAR